jgi:Family of unknown function (DUF6498)
MPGTAIRIDPRALLAPRYLLHPSTLLLLFTNLLPLVGVICWRWDAFLLLMLYWMETAIIGFWTIVRIGVSPPGAMGPLYVNGKPTSSRAALVGFFIVHSGMFMGVHFVFLWSLFSGEWGDKVHGPESFVDQVVLQTGLWAPLAAFFISRGLIFVFHDLKPDLLQNLERALFGRVVQPRTAPPPSDPGQVLFGFYGRIVMMQVAIIFGAFLSEAFGSIVPFVLLIVIKTGVDLSMHVALDMDSPVKKSV